MQSFLNHLSGYWLIGIQIYPFFSSSNPGRFCVTSSKRDSSMPSISSNGKRGVTDSEALQLRVQHLRASETSHGIEDTPVCSLGHQFGVIFVN